MKNIYINIVKKGLVWLVCGSLLMGCAGRAANPVMSSQPGDERMSCSALKSEMNEIQGNINKLLPKESRTGQNVALGVAGAFFIVPLFFMNFSDAEKIEINAYRTRYNHLVRIYNDKNCGAAAEELPDFTKKPAKARKAAAA